MVMRKKLSLTQKNGGKPENSWVGEKLVHAGKNAKTVLSSRCTRIHARREKSTTPE